MIVSLLTYETYKFGLRHRLMICNEGSSGQETLRYLSLTCITKTIRPATVNLKNPALTNLGHT
jgi:hypothetical protein